jgi:hypothetical protein
MTPVVAIADRAQMDLRHFAQQARPNETGGIVLGVFASGRPWITDVVQIRPRRPRPDRYRIPSGMTPRLVARHQLRDPRLGYLGDWHTHPADLPVSGTDQSVLQRVALDTAAGVKHPLLVLVRLGADGWVIDVLEARGRRHVRCAIKLTGQLPPT